MAVRGNAIVVDELAGEPGDLAAAERWLATADAVVRGRIVNAGASETLLTRITEHLAAHYLVLGPGLVKSSERFPDYSYALATELLGKLGATPNGQAVMALDPSGMLADAGKPTPTFVVL
jgi:hypothetical protein